MKTKIALSAAVLLACAISGGGAFAQCAFDDGFEDNDGCGVAALLQSPSSEYGLFVSKSDPDFYRVVVPDGETLFVDIQFFSATSDLDLRLYDFSSLLFGTCGGWNPGDYIASSTSTTDDEQIVYTNTLGGDIGLYLQVYVKDDPAGVGDCNTYDLLLDIHKLDVATPLCFGDGTADDGGGPVGCPCGNGSVVGSGEGCINSLGFGAILAATGSASVANDDLGFDVTQAIPGETSVLLQGSSLIALPFKDGILCMGNPTERVEVVFLDGSGSGSTSSSIVTEGHVSAGQTRYYQLWYRNSGGVSPCGTGSNFSNALMVDWN